MPWSSQGGGGWKGGGGPWGQGPSGGGHQQPDLEELLKRGQDKFKQVIPGGSGVPGPLLFLLAVALAAIVAFYAFTFRVNPDELGVVMRFGQYVRQEPPGLHFRLPYPIEEVSLPKVTRQNTIDIGFRSAGGGRNFQGGMRDVPEESLMLTGDENIVDVDFVVYWRIRTDRDAKTGQRRDVHVARRAGAAEHDVPERFALHNLRRRHIGMVIDADVIAV